MINQDLTIVSGGIPKYSNDTLNTNGTTDDMEKKATPEYSEIDPYFWMYGKNYSAVVSQTEPDLLTKKFLDKDLREQDDIKNDILIPSLANIQDSELKLKAIELISSMKDNPSFDISAVINGIMDNFGLEDSIDLKKALILRLKKVLPKKPDDGKKITDNVNEDNSSLYGNTYKIPAKIISHIKKELKLTSNGKTKGYTFAVNIVKNPNISYSNMKRKLGIMKDIDKNSKEYKLYGGDLMLSFLMKKLDTSRTQDKDRKKALDTTSKTNVYKKPKSMATVPTLSEAKTLTENYSFNDVDYIGNCNGELDIMDMSLLPMDKLIYLLKDCIIPNLQKYSVPTLMSINNEFKTNPPKNSMDMARILNMFDLCICKMGGGDKKVYVPKFCHISDMGNGFHLLALKNCQLQMDSDI